eukprot:m.84057 g.84057  ORF g.84057 m.84057 type:complete len:403 (+) comp11263_c0_seq1:225-1433(+)
MRGGCAAGLLIWAGCATTARSGTTLAERPLREINDLIASTTCRNVCSKHCRTLTNEECTCLRLCNNHEHGFVKRPMRMKTLKSAAQKYQLNETAICSKTGKQAFPTVMILGVQKGGTTTMLQDLLSGFPQLTGPTIPEERLNIDASFIAKELHFFDIPSRYERGAPFYGSYFPTCDQMHKDQIIPIEATPNYFSSVAENPDDEAWERAGRFYTEHTSLEARGRLTFVVVVRDPALRYISAFNHFCIRDKSDAEHCKGLLAGMTNGMNTPECIFEMSQVSLQGCFAYLLKTGVYWQPLAGWVNNFPESRFVVTTYTQYTTDPHSVLQAIGGNVGLSLTENNFKDRLVSNRGTYDGIDPEEMVTAKKKLDQYYSEHSDFFWRLLENYVKDPALNVAFVGKFREF